MEYFPSNQSTKYDIERLSSSQTQTCISWGLNDTDGDTGGRGSFFWPESFFFFS